MGRATPFRKCSAFDPTRKAKNLPFRAPGDRSFAAITPPFEPAPVWLAHLGRAVQAETVVRVQENAGTSLGQPASDPSGRREAVDSDRRPPAPRAGSPGSHVEEP